MKLKYLIIGMMIFVGISMLFWMRSIDKALWKHVDELISICYKDEFHKKVNSFREYNGITEINHKYKLRVHYLELDDEVFVIYFPETIDSISKEPKTEFLTLFYKNGKSILLKGNFSNCNEE